MVNHFIDDKIAEMLSRYEDDMAMTFGDLVEGVEDVLKENYDEDISFLVEKYRREERYDMDFLGMRGDMESVEEAFLKVLYARAGDISNKKQEELATPNEWDYTLIQQVIENKRPYPAVLIEKVIGAKTYELPLLENAGYILQGDSYMPPVELK